jgi:mannosyltransferase OCH1-like enzyme
MKRFNSLVHYIWVGENSTPDSFYGNYRNTIAMNPSYGFILWKDSDILENFPHIKELYLKSTLFHKLQLARYSVLDKFGGIYTDFDIRWKVDFDHLYSLFDEVDMIFPKRRGLYFYNRGMKTTMIDDFVIIAKKHKTSDFLKFCQSPCVPKLDETFPYGTPSLTEWLMTKESVGYITPEQIYDEETCELAVHENKKTWQKLNAP